MIVEVIYLTQKVAHYSKLLNVHLLRNTNYTIFKINAIANFILKSRHAPLWQISSSSKYSSLMNLHLFNPNRRLSVINDYPKQIISNILPLYRQ